MGERCLQKLTSLSNEQYDSLWFNSELHVHMLLLEIGNFLVLYDIIVFININKQYTFSDPKHLADTWTFG